MGFEPMGLFHQLTYFNMHRTAQFLNLKSSQGFILPGNKNKPVEIPCCHILNIRYEIYELTVMLWVCILGGNHPSHLCAWRSVPRTKRETNPHLCAAEVDNKIVFVEGFSNGCVSHGQEEGGTETMIVLAIPTSAVISVSIVPTF